MSHDLTTTWKKALMYISSYSKFTQLFNAVAFFKSNNIYCYLQMLNFDDQAAYDLSPSW